MGTTRLVLAFLLLPVFAMAHSTGSNWAPAGTVVSKTSGWSFYVSAVALNGGTFSGNNVPSVAGMFTNYATTVTGTTTKAVTTAVTSATNSFYIEIGKQDPSGNKTPFQRWYSTPSGSPVAVPLDYVAPNDWVDPVTGDHKDDYNQPKTYTATANMEGGPIGQRRHWVVKSTRTSTAAQSTEHEAIIEGDGGQPHIWTVTHNYPFTLDASYTVIATDTDEDGIKDEDDPYPTDATNHGWYGEVLADADNDGTPNWQDGYPYDPTKGAPTTPTTTKSPSGSKDAFVAVIKLDNSTFSTSGVFVITAISDANGTVILTKEVTCLPFETRLQEITAGEAFTCSVLRSDLIDGEKVNPTTVAQDQKAGSNPDASETSSPTTTPPKTTTVASSTGSSGTAAVGTDATSAANAVSGEVRRASDAITGSLNNVCATIEGIGDKLDDMVSGYQNTADGATITEDGKVTAVKTAFTAVGTSLSGLSSKLGFGQTVSGSSLNFTLDLGSLGTHQFDFESRFSSAFATLRNILLWCFMVHWLFEFIKTVRGFLV